MTGLANRRAPRLRRRTDRSIDQDAVTAYHEAGHAVMAWLHGEWIRDRGIRIADPGEAVLGSAHTNSHVAPELLACTWFLDVSSLPESARAAAQAQIRGRIRWDVRFQVSVLLAGRLAEIVAAAEQGVGCEELLGGGGEDPEPLDPQDAEFCLVLLCLDPPPAFGPDSDPRAALALVEALHAVEGQRGGVGRYLAEACETTARTLRRRDVWRAVKRVASALYAARKLTSDEFEDLMAQVPPRRLSGSDHHERFIPPPP